MKVMKGTVKFFDEMKGYGFITAESGDDYFVHQSDLKEGTTLAEGDNVEFEVGEGDRGPKAVNVSKGSSESSSEEEEKEE